MIKRVLYRVFAVVLAIVAVLLAASFVPAMKQALHTTNIWTLRLFAFAIIGVIWLALNYLLSQRTFYWRTTPINVGGQKQATKQMFRSDSGQDVAEYAVMLALILVIVVGTIKLIGTNANTIFSSVGSSIGGETGK